MNSDRLNFKVVLLGEGSVGKSSLVMRFMDHRFNDSTVSTAQAAFRTKKMTLSERQVNLAVWDTAGQERFHALGPIYYRDSHGALLVYDITDEDSLRKVKKWVAELRKMLGNDVTIAVVGNKIDLERKRMVDQSAAESYAESVNAEHYETSAKLNTGIDELFYDMTKRIVAVHDARAQRHADREAAAAGVISSSSGTAAVRNATILVDDETGRDITASDAPRKSCC